MLSILVENASHAQSTQVINLQNLCNIARKKIGMKFIFGADKHHSFLQVDFMIFDEHD